MITFYGAFNNVAENYQCVGAVLNIVRYLYLRCSLRQSIEKDSHWTFQTNFSACNTL